MEILDEITKAFAEFEAKKTKLITQLKEEFPKLLAPLFEKHPVVKFINWRQYTPFFNDGDVCEFGRYEISINDQMWYDQKDGTAESLAHDDFESVMSTIPNEMYQDIFGDHCEVFIYRDGTIKVEAYDHD